MKIVTWTIASLLATFLMSSEQGPAAVALEPSPAAHFPSVKASNLEKRDFNLPADFEGDRNLVLVAFEREQQEDVDTWLREMKHFEEADPGLHYYELPTIQRPGAFLRWFIDTGMRHGIPDRKARERTIPLYLEKKPFLDSLLIVDQNKIYALLVDREGRVLWRSDGVFDDTKAAGLSSALRQHRQ
jgi:hypothetical protein